MRSSFLKTYEITLTTLAPVFIGSGKEISKKEYVFVPGENKVMVMDQAKLYRALKDRCLAKQFETYLIDIREKKNLAEWLSKSSIKIPDLNSAVKYKIDCGDRMKFSNKSQIQIMEFVKDPYGKPYIPGSSLKGMLRTILLSEIAQNDFDGINQIRKKTKSNDNIRRDKYLKEEIERIESQAFRTLGREKYNNDSKVQIKSSSAVNDVFQGLVISDSAPLELDDLVLCQRLEKHTNGEEKLLNVLRECIKPGVVIRFKVSIDTTTCKFTPEIIMNAISKFASCYYENFSCVFRTDRPLDDTVYLGGGVGFVSKTVIYPMFSKEEGLKNTVKIFEKTGVPYIHKHKEDDRKGASPHVLKCTRYNGHLYEMGKCRFEIKEISI